MNLNRQLFLLALSIAASISLTLNVFGQATVIPVHVQPHVNSHIQPVAQQLFAGGVQAPAHHQPGLVQRAGFSQHVSENYPGVGSWIDYTPELIGTYAPVDGYAARQIGVATLTDNALGHGRHSPVGPNRIAQASYFQPVAQGQQLLSNYSTIAPANASGNVLPAHIAGLASLDEAPRLFRDQNIGGGRSIFTAFWDKHWTRMVLIYGGFGNSEDNNADIFDGQASTNLGVVGVDIGRRHSRFMRSSIDFTYRGGNVDFQGQDAGEVRVYSLMKNFHLDLARRGQFRPYIGLGIGGGVLDADADLGGNSVTVDDEGSFAYQIIGGAAVNISDLASIYAEYRYFSLTSLDVASTSGIVEGTFTSHDVLFGLRFGY